jgi:extracellular elastinolytic metalloproteinase
MYLFPAVGSLGTPSANGGDDASVVYHEYTHGLSSRLITHADGTEALDSAHAGAMGEAWSDFYAMDYLVSSGYEVDGAGADLILGRYMSAGHVGFLRYDAIDCAVTDASANCPGGAHTGPGGFTFADFGKVSDGPEVHSDGEIWSQTLWELRTALGSPTTMSIVTRAMELSPPEPSFLDMRNAIIEADRIASGGANEDAIWHVFADRGMGFFAVANDGADTHPVADFSMPPTCPANCGTITGTITDRATGHAVSDIRVSVAGHDTGFLGDLADVTDASGGFTIADVPFHTYALGVSAPAYEAASRNVTVDGDEDLELRLTRDWASIGGGARLRSSTPPDYSAYGCGPGLAFDGDVTTGWGSDAPSNRSSGVTGPRSAVVRLPRSIDVTTFGFATGGTCGDEAAARVRAFSIQTRRANSRHWTTAYVNRRSLTASVMHTLRPRRGTDNVRYVRVIMRSSSGDHRFMDMLELSVRGTAA